MDLMKSAQSEDLSKDLQGNPWISPQKHKDFMIRLRIEIKGNDPTQTDL